MIYLLRVISAVLVTACILCSFSLGTGVLVEGYVFLKPDIDTYYTDGYSEAKFNAIKVGDSVDSVAASIGQPFEKQSLERGDTLWYYSRDGKCEWGDFAWLLKGVIVDKNRHVKELLDGVCYD
jgi:hypothetical protein